mmetsp:Transcript_58060/g.93984  ORF Transcript_58060/g.93984 Transcript_58060/m.93984 type:complete len:144 (-) Transcript_58060:13-444(-)
MSISSKALEAASRNSPMSETVLRLQTSRNLASRGTTGSQQAGSMLSHSLQGLLGGAFGSSAVSKLLACVTDCALRAKHELSSQNFPGAWGSCHAEISGAAAQLRGTAAHCVRINLWNCKRPWQDQASHNDRPWQDLCSCNRRN